MRCEGVPQALHGDAAPEQKVEKIMEINMEMKVKDNWSEPGHPNQNPVEAIGMKPLKLGVQATMQMQCDNEPMNTQKTLTIIVLPLFLGRKHPFQSDDMHMTLQLSCNASSGNPSIQRLMNNHK